MVYTFQAKAFVQSGVYGNNQFLCIKSHATKNRHNYNIFLTQPTKFLFCLIEMETNCIYILVSYTAAFYAVMQCFSLQAAICGEDYWVMAQRAA